MTDDTNRVPFIDLENCTEQECFDFLKRSGIDPTPYVIAESEAVQAQDVLDFITRMGGKPAHYVIADGALYWKVYDDLSWQTGTPRQVDINKRIVEGMRRMDEAFDALQATIETRDWDAVKLACEQTRHTIFAMYGQVVEIVYPQVGLSTKRSEIGKEGGRTPHDRDAICHDYDTWMCQGNDRPMVIVRLARKYETSKAVINRILRDEGRGAHNKKQKT